MRLPASGMRPCAPNALRQEHLWTRANIMQSRPARSCQPTPGSAEGWERRPGGALAAAARGCGPNGIDKAFRRGHSPQDSCPARRRRGPGCACEPARALRGWTLALAGLVPRARGRVQSVHHPERTNHGTTCPGTGMRVVWVEPGVPSKGLVNGTAAFSERLAFRFKPP